MDSGALWKVAFSDMRGAARRDVCKKRLSLDVVMCSLSCELPFTCLNLRQK